MQVNSTLFFYLTNSTNQSSQCLTVSIIDDNTLESIEYFIAALVTLDFDGNSENDQITIGIEDNDGKYRY